MNKATLIDTLTKFKQSPGLCTNEEILDARVFFSKLNDMLKIYVKVGGLDAYGGTVEADLARADWYVHNK